MAPLISEELPCAPETIDVILKELPVRKLSSCQKDSDVPEKCIGGIGYDLAKILLDAVQSGRATHGVFECAQLLTNNPDNVMLCVLPEASDHPDVTVHIQHTLIEAFCWENEIQLIKVDSVSKLAGLLSVKPAADALLGQLSCALVQFPSGDMSPEEERLAGYIDNVMFSNVYPRPVIKLPE